MPLSTPTNASPAQDPSSAPPVVLWQRSVIAPVKSMRVVIGPSGTINANNARSGHTGPTTALLWLSAACLVQRGALQPQKEPRFASKRSPRISAADVVGRPRSKADRVENRLHRKPTHLLPRHHGGDGSAAIPIYVGDSARFKATAPTDSIIYTDDIPYTRELRKYLYTLIESPEEYQKHLARRDETPQSGGNTGVVLFLGMSSRRGWLGPPEDLVNVEEMYVVCMCWRKSDEI